MRWEDRIQYGTILFMKRGSKNVGRKDLRDMGLNRETAKDRDVWRAAISTYKAFQIEDDEYNM